MGKQVIGVVKNSNSKKIVLIKQTVSLCPVCLNKISADIIEIDNKTYMRKKCPQHGTWQTLIWQGNTSYKKWRKTENNTKPAHSHMPVEYGCPHDCGMCSEHQQEACCVLINVTNRCNQKCSFCFANSDTGSANQDMSLESISKIYDFLHSQSPDNTYGIQISGGEPTVRDDLPEIIQIGKAKGFTYIQVNTNGKRLADSLEYAQSLRQAGLDSVFLQFDGTNDSIYQQIRGEALFAVKKKAIENCRQAGLPVVLVMTVVPKSNLNNIGETLDFMLANLPTVRGIHFQPVSYFGRFPQAPDDCDRLNLAGLIEQIAKQSDARISQKDFLPLLTGHSHCSFHGNFVMMPNGKIVSISSEADANCCSCKQDAIVQARNYITKKWSHKPKSILAGNNTDLADWDLFLKQADTKGFSITAMAFQDAWNVDLERLQKCRVFVATADEKMIPFCVYNMTDSKGRFLYGGCR